MNVAEQQVMSAGPCGVVVADASAIAAALERLVLEFDKVRRSALRQVHLGPRDAYLLRLAAQPDGVRLGLFRDRVGLTDQRASQIARSLKARRLVKRIRDSGNARVRVVVATANGRETLAKLDGLLTTVMETALAEGDASPLRTGIAVAVAALSAEGNFGDENKAVSHPRRAAKNNRTGNRGLMLWE